MPPRATSSSALPASASAAAPPGRTSAVPPGAWSPSTVVSVRWSPSFFFFMNAVGAHASSAPPHHRRSVFPETLRASLWPMGVVHAPTAPMANAAGMSVTLFCVYAYDPAVVAHVTATTVVPMIFFAVIPRREHAGTNTTAPPRPVRADSAPAPVPQAVVPYCHPGLSGALTHAAGAAFDGAAPGREGFTTRACAAKPLAPRAPATGTEPRAACAAAPAAPAASFAARAAIAPRAVEKCGALDRRRWHRRRDRAKGGGDSSLFRDWCATWGAVWITRTPKSAVRNRNLHRAELDFTNRP